MESKLLRIVIPTYNRAEKLRLMLQTVLPQLVGFEDCVDIAIYDNASSDHTKEVVSEFSNHHKIMYYRNGINVGFFLNLVLSVTSQQGCEYVWTLGDDDLLTPGTIHSVVTAIKQQPEYELYCLNAQTADFPEDWPTECWGGYTGKSTGMLEASMENRHFDEWEKYLTKHNCMSTPIYASILKLDMWKKYWDGQGFDRSWTSVQSTYPHTYFIAASMVHRPCYLIGHPCTTIFNGGQSWNNVADKVMLTHCVELIEYYQSLGVDREIIKPLRNHVYGCWVGDRLEMHFRNGSWLKPISIFLQNKLTRPIAYYYLGLVAAKSVFLRKEVSATSYTQLAKECIRRMIKK